MFLFVSVAQAAGLQANVNEVFRILIRKVTDDAKTLAELIYA
jgi:hypothetical protein